MRPKRKQSSLGKKPGTTPKMHSPNWGGKRRGSGRSVRPITLLRYTYLGEKIIVKRFSYGQVRRHKTTLIESILDNVFIRAMAGDIKLAKAYLEYAYGKIPVAEQEPKDEDDSRLKQIFMDNLEKSYGDFAGLIKDENE